MNELKHYGVPGMRWGHRKKTFDYNEYKTAAIKLGRAKYEERGHYRQAAGAIGEKRRNSFADKAEAKRKEVESLQTEFNNKYGAPKTPQRQITNARASVARATRLSNTGLGVVAGTLALGTVLAAGKHIKVAGGKSAAKYALSTLGLITLSAAPIAAATNLGSKVVNKMLDKKEQKLNNKK